MPARLRSSVLASSLLACWACSSPPAPAADKPAAPTKAADPAGGAVVAAASPAPRSDLPPELSVDALKEVLEPVKVAARQTCRAMSRGGERVEVELTIAGSTGAVSHTSVWQDAGNTALADCVAGELRRARFAPTQKASTRQPVAIQF